MLLTYAFSRACLSFSLQQLGPIMDSLAEEGVLNHYDPEDLEMLAADMDVDGS